MRRAGGATGRWWRALGWITPTLLLMSACGGVDASTKGQQAVAPAPGGDEAAPGDLSGLVTAQDGQPIAGALVSVVDAAVLDDEPAAQVKSGADGRFRVSRLPTGRYGITVTAPGVTGTRLEVLSHRAETPTRGLVARLGGRGIVVQGAVRDPAGKGVPGATVVATRQGEGGVVSFFAPVAPEGHYQIMLPEGRYDVAVKAPGHVAGGPEGGRPVTESAQVDMALRRAPPLDQAAPAEVVSWIQQQAMPLGGTEAGRGLADMAPIKAMVGNARVVSLGEATHGTREFFALKHRMLELLVTELGFTVFAIEGSSPASLAVNEYVLTGKGDPVKALQGLEFWTWNTEEMLALVRWMRRYNENPAHKQKLRFHGFDLEDPQQAVHALLSHLRKVDRPLAQEVSAQLRPLDNEHDVERYPQRGDTVMRATRAAIVRVAEQLDRERPTYERRAGAAAWKLARHHARLLQRTEAMLADPRGGAALREQGMAENVLSLLDLEGPDAKAVLWSHNVHAQRGGQEAYPSMGEHLHRTLGAEHVVFGFGFNQGSFLAVELNPVTGNRLRDFTVGPGDVGTLDATLAKGGVPLFALDLRRAPADGLVGGWLDAALGTRSIGSVYRESSPASSFRRSAPRGALDALLFVERTTATRPLASVRRGRPPSPPPAAVLSNPGFEEVNGRGAAAGWTAPLLTLDTTSTDVATSEQRPRSGKRAAALRVVPRGPSTVGAHALATQTLDAAPFRGKRVRLTVATRVEGLSAEGRAQLFLETVGAKGQPIGYADLLDQPITSTAWADHGVALDIPSEAATLTLGLVLIGDGQAFFDDVRLEALGNP
ncbi:erythromycin esterase family protein [Chondromyces crocatus]|nr:erythromycin esterase family protein [Chondromyces crocatus]